MKWTIDECQDALGFDTLRLSDGSVNGDIYASPIATIYEPSAANLIAAAPDLLATLKAIADESIFNQQRFAEDDDTDYFLRCFKAVKERCHAAIAKAEGNGP